jgi:hypothetical protein
MFSREVVRQLAVSNGFLFKAETDQVADLKPYVYDFYQAVFDKVKCDGFDAVDRDYIRQQAEVSGFKAKEQYSGKVDINPYVYLFAFEVAKAAKLFLSGVSEDDLAHPDLSGIPVGWQSYIPEILACFEPQGVRYAKEKFGELRVAGVQTTEEQKQRLQVLNSVLKTTCMHCGTQDDVFLNTQGWIGPSCHACHERRHQGG